jgi:N-acetylmuramoyl-L-alanine amidase
MASQLAEKDITLAFALGLRQQLQSRGLTTLLLRDSDTTLTLDQRAAATNVAKAEIYICLHASSEGHGVRLYTAMLPAGGGDSGPFLDWDTAQSPFLPLSKAAVTGLASELQKQRVPVRVLMAPLRPLNNITTAAVAVEVAPSEGGVEDLNSPAYQQLVTSSLAAGVLSVRDKLEAGR